MDIRHGESRVPEPGSGDAPPWLVRAERTVWRLTAARLDELAGRALTDDELSVIAAAVERSSIPEALTVVVDACVADSSAAGCLDCVDRGYVLVRAVHGDGSHDWVERCDTCRRYRSDDLAASAAAADRGASVGYAVPAGCESSHPYLRRPAGPMPEGTDWQAAPDRSAACVDWVHQPSDDTFGIRWRSIGDMAWCEIVCPRCGGVNSVREEDSAIRWNTVEARADGSLLVYLGDPGDWEVTDNGYFCDDCGAHGMLAPTDPDTYL